MNTDAQNFLKKFSTKKDALVALDMLIKYDSSYQLLWQEIDKHNDQDLAQRVMDYFNEVNDSHYRNADRIASVIRQIPKVGFEQFQSVILHKKETWGGDPKMKPYLSGVRNTVFIIDLEKVKETFNQLSLQLRQSRK